MKSRNGKPAPKYRFGDRVQFEFGGRIVWGMITEDRGIIGHDGRRVYYVSMPFDPYDSELNIKDEEELEPDTISRVPLEKAEIIGFLKNSGLTSILVWNPSSEREDPAVWLSRGAHGQITYTFSARRGMIGGRMIPYLAHQTPGRIVAEKREEVADFLLSFGLTPEEAEDVIQAVGVTPVKKRRRKKETA
jgi:hypothetical protein